MRNTVEKTKFQSTKLGPVLDRLAQREWTNKSHPSGFACE